jgi:uncharacterized repeat protein (TIGR01451 family)
MNLAAQTLRLKPKTLMSILSIFAAAGLISAQFGASFANGATTLPSTADLKAGVSVNTQVRKIGDSSWANQVSAKPGDHVQFLITYQNTGNVVLKSIFVRDILPPRTVIVPDTTFIKNSLNPNGTLNASSTGVSLGGIDTGNAAPGAQTHVWFEAALPAAADLSCGTSTLKNVGVSRPKGLPEYSDSATVLVTKTCAQPAKPKPAVSAPTPAPKVVKQTPTPVSTKTVTRSTPTSTSVVTHTAQPAKPVTTTKVITRSPAPAAPVTSSSTANASATVTVTQTPVAVTPPTPTPVTTPAVSTTPVTTPPATTLCTGLQVQDNGNRNITAMVDTLSAEPAEFSSVTFSYGDGSSDFTTDFKIGNHTYMKDGTYLVTASPTFAVFDGSLVKKVTTHDAACTKMITINSAKVLASTSPAPVQPVTPAKTVAASTDEVDDTSTTPIAATPVAVSTAIPDTGMGNVIGLFIVASTGAAVMHYLVRRRLLRL